MEHIVTVQDAVTAFADFMEPTPAELDAIEREMPVILADVELLDAQILTLDRTPNEVNARRIRRARCSTEVSGVPHASSASRTARRTCPASVTSAQA
ncbi:DUF6284 family protein [Streptomyces sp. NPDC005568]|uniref:DUF6284 family protein n=1 Tax=Streptomyces sp. NPDC005568 TaxID=3156887 RepID=UPI00339F7322